jgi:c-di-GMP-binding flagellar brake protein YcgR
MGRYISLNLERRKIPRLKDNIFILVNLKSNQNGLFKTVTKDISGSGLMFETERDIPKGSKLELEVYQPLDSFKRMIFSVLILAKVVWKRKIEKDNFEKGENKYRVGVIFLKISEEDRKKILKYVSRKK